MIESPSLELGCDAAAHESNTYNQFDAGGAAGGELEQQPSHAQPKPARSLHLKKPSRDSQVPDPQGPSQRATGAQRDPQLIEVRDLGPRGSTITYSRTHG